MSLLRRALVLVLGECSGVLVLGECCGHCLPGATITPFKSCWRAVLSLATSTILCRVWDYLTSDIWHVTLPFEPPHMSAHVRWKLLENRLVRVGACLAWNVRIDGINVWRPNDLCISVQIGTLVLYLTTSQCGSNVMIKLVIFSHLHVVRLSSSFNLLLIITHLPFSYFI